MSRVLLAATLASVSCGKSAHHSSSSVAGGSSGEGGSSSTAMGGSTAGANVGGAEARGGVGAGGKPVGGAEAGAGQVVAGEGGAPPTPDDAPSAEELHYEDYLRKQDGALTQRFRECFHSPEGTVLSDRRLVHPVLADSLRLGLVTSNVAAEAECLGALATVPCDRLAALIAHSTSETPDLPGCQEVLVGHAAAGSPCLNDEDCESPSEHYCAAHDTCGRVCTRRTDRAPGDPCVSWSDRCSNGTRCQFTEEGERCVAPSGEGALCRTSNECAALLHCTTDGSPDTAYGRCRPIAVGSSCVGYWDCAYGYVCELDSNADGTCQVGKGEGELCTTHPADVNGIPHSNCAPPMQCLDRDGSGARCTRGNPLGARCGALFGADGPWVECAEGNCETDVGSTPPVGNCIAPRPPGSSCQSNLECAAPMLCVQDGAGQACRERPIGLARGAACTITHSECGHGAYCAPPADWDPLSPLISLDGICSSWRRVGETCRELDVCEPLSACIQGHCQKCPAASQ